MYNHVLPMFLGTFAATVLLVLISVSAPLIRVFYFLETSDDNGVRFGIWGYCATTCTAAKLGYTFETKITEPLSSILVLFPAAAGVSLISLIVLLPLLRSPRSRTYPILLSCMLSFLAAALSIAAFVVLVYITAVALSAFQKEGDTATLGPLIWMSLVSSVLLFLVALGAGCGLCFGGRFGRKREYLEDDQ